eukprot:COSAG06_NODE_2441_length_6871_cov_9.359716_9_plen_67_part_00
MLRPSEGFEPTLCRAHWILSPTPYAPAPDCGLAAALLSGGGSGGALANLFASDERTRCNKMYNSTC